DGDLVATLQLIFRQNWHGEVIRNVAVYTGRLAPDTGEQLNFFEPIDQQIKATNLERTLDTSRDRFGFKGLIYAKSAMHG
ncbi:hypothetical protein PJP11_29370, partial [Mycobacterium kansasii]